jgi:hypothetical protein
LCIQRGGSVTAWETCRTLLRRLPLGADVIAATLPGSYLSHMLRTDIDHDRLFMHEASDVVADEGAVARLRHFEDGLPVVLGDRDLELVPSLRTWPAVGPRGAERMRTIDTLYGGTHRPGLLVIEDATAAARILDGAVETVHRHRPMILASLTTCALSERSAVWEECAARLEGLGYVWVDGLMLPRVTREQRNEAVTACASDVLCALQSRAVEADLPTDLLSLLADAGKPVASIAWTDWAIQVSLDPQRIGPIALPFDNRMAASGLHPAEHDGSGTWWRWSGPSAHARLHLPLPSAGHWRVRFEVMNWGAAKTARDLQVFVQGKPTPCVEHGEYFGCFGPIAVPGIEACGVLNVDIVTPSPRRASDQDPRRIGVNFTRCVLERAA